MSRLEEQARELKERERLLVFFPELHVPAEMQFESEWAAAPAFPPVVLCLWCFPELAADLAGPGLTIICTPPFVPLIARKGSGPGLC